MPDYRRFRVPGGTYFFTLVTHFRRRFLTGETARQALRNAINTIREKRAFRIPAIVLLPEHLHAIWELPPGDHDFSTRWNRIKEEFTKAWLAAGGCEGPLSESRRKRKERGIWQRRFWEHVIEDEHDFERHFDYIHYNPVKHAEVSCPGDWPYSTFQRWVDKGVYQPEWGCLHHGVLNFDDLDETAMEYHLDDESAPRS